MEMKKIRNIWWVGQRVGLMLLLLLLMVAIPFLHNHPAGTPETANCPAYILQISLIGLVIFILEYIFISLPFHKIAIPLNPNTLCPFTGHRYFIRRAPPQ